MVDHAEPLAFDELAQLDTQMTEWGHQGFEDIASIVFEDRRGDDLPPILDEADIIARRVRSIKVQGADAFVHTDDGRILHYRMTVERL